MTNFEDFTRDSAWPPTTNGMPLLGSDYPDTLLAQYIAASGSLDGELHALTVTLARLSDKAVREYQAASHCLDSFIGTPLGVESLEGHTHLLRATDHLESCIDAVRRAELFLNTPAFVQFTTPTNRQMLEDLHSGVRAIRNSIQHADERLAKGRIPPGDPLFPAMTTDALYFAGEFVVYGEIVALVMMLWEFASAGVNAVTD